MSGHRQKADPDLCWNCGKPGAVLGLVGDRRNCPECEVTWGSGWSATRGDLNYVCWMGTVVFCVDFTKPESEPRHYLRLRSAIEQIPGPLGNKDLGTERTWYLPLGQRGELCRVRPAPHAGSPGGAVAGDAEREPWRAAVRQAALTEMPPQLPRRIEASPQAPTRPPPIPACQVAGTRCPLVLFITVDLISGFVSACDS